VTAEDIAVPRWNIVDDFMEGLGRAAVAAVPRPVTRAEPPRPPRDWHALHPEPPAEPPPRRGYIYIYPWISGILPWGCAPRGPMGEGSEDTAVPPVDPAEARLCPEQLDLAVALSDLWAMGRLQEKHHPA
jgi:hypothetical protein